MWRAMKESCQCNFVPTVSQSCAVTDSPAHHVLSTSACLPKLHFRITAFPSVVAAGCSTPILNMDFLSGWLLETCTTYTLAVDLACDLEESACTTQHRTETGNHSVPLQLRAGSAAPRRRQNEELTSHAAATKKAIIETHPIAPRVQSM